MKNIIYVLILIIVMGWFAPGFITTADATNTIMIQSTDKHVSSEILARSAEIITGRLKDYSSEKFDVTVIPERNQIKLVLTDSWDLKVVETLLLQKGTFAFYETFDQERLTELLKGDDHLFSLFNSQSRASSSGPVGCTTYTEAEKVKDYITTLAMSRHCKFAWSPLSDQGDICLYALQSDADKSAPLSGKDIENVKCSMDSASGSATIEIIFREASAALWSAITARNINRVIAIVLDNKVISAPMVREAIKGGSCQITGNFTTEEARTMAALTNNGELPVEFEIVK